MRSRASFFSGAVFRRDMRRLAPLWLAYLLAWLVLMPLSILTAAQQGGLKLADLQYMVLLRTDGWCSILLLVYAALTATALHSWLCTTQGVNLMAALPVRREALFCTHTATAMVMGLGPQVLTALLSWGACAMAGFPSPEPALWWLGITALQYIFYYGLAAFCASLTGQILAIPVFYGIANVAVVALERAVVSILQSFVYGMPNLDLKLQALSPAFYLNTQGFISQERALVNGESQVIRSEFLAWKYVWIIAAVGVLLLVLSFLLLRARRMEAAGDIVVFRGLRPVFRYGLTVGCSLVLGVMAASLLLNGRGPRLALTVCCLLAGGLVGFLAAQLLLKRSLRVPARGWTGFGVFAVCLLGAALLMEQDAFGYERRVPEPAEVSSVTLQGTFVWNSPELDSPEKISAVLTLHHSILQEKDRQLALKDLDDAQDRTLEPGVRQERLVDSRYLELIYHLENGKTMKRSYTIYCDQPMWLDPASLPRQYAALMDDPELLLKQNTPPFPTEDVAISGCVRNFNTERGYSMEEALSGRELRELYETCILPDLADSVVGIYPRFKFEDLSQQLYECDVSVNFEDPRAETEGDGFYYMAVSPSVGSRTARWLLDHGYELTLQKDAQEQMEAGR